MEARESGVGIGVVGVGVRFVGDWVGCEGCWSMKYSLVSVEGEVVEGERGRVEAEDLSVRGVFSGLLTCGKLAGDARLGFRVFPENFMWCLVSISQSEIGWKPSLIKAFRKRGLACSTAETLTEAFIAENRDCLSASEGV